MQFVIAHFLVAKVKLRKIGEALARYWKFFTEMEPVYHVETSVHSSPPQPYMGMHPINLQFTVNSPKIMGNLRDACQYKVGGGG